MPFCAWSFAEDTSIRKQIIHWYAKPVIEGIADELIPPFIPLEKKSSMLDMPFAAAYSELSAQQRIDALNLTYVAFTRAVEHLVVITHIPKTSGDTVGKYLDIARSGFTPECLEKAVSSMPADTARWIVSLADKYDAESESLRFGSIKAPGVTHKEDKLLFPMPDYATDDNSDLLCRVKVETDSDFDPEDARVTGNFMHSVMSKVTSASDLEFACRYQARQVGLPEEIAKKRYRFLADAISKP